MEEADEFERQEEQEAEAAEVRIDEDEEGAAPTEGDGPRLVVGPASLSRPARLGSRARGGSIAAQRSRSESHILMTFVYGMYVIVLLWTPVYRQQSTVVRVYLVVGFSLQYALKTVLLYLFSYTPDGAKRSVLYCA
ncbi:hypothetical protein AXG93_1154s1190 [Marchantia polymorpha subsp. ruderalis]|uniref:Uncharacterized protein n=1 Tax=Marchantia polymorpha subsp. ruderalis TaxID=1480154 RepID=A0A176WT21_MARPO|nr:hypothetical protein AXG93_1154s1190 [Marchantia polymorpha subsp. ruderalis]